GAVLDLFNVLLEPTAVFERVREKPKFLAPFLVICALQMIIGFLNLPFTQAAMHAMAASRPAAPAGAPDPAKFAAIGLLFVPVGLLIAYVISAGLLWFLASGLKAINPFTIWGLILTAIGVTVTHKTSKGTGYTVATVSFLIGVLVAGGLASLFGGRAG